MENSAGQEPSTVPSVHGRYAVRTSLLNNVLALTILHVERRWMPMSLFGRVILTKLVRLHPTDDCGVVQIQHGSLGLISTADATRQSILLGLEWPAALRESALNRLVKALHKPASTLSFRIQGFGAILAVLLVAYMALTLVTTSASRAVSVAQGAQMVAPVTSTVAPPDARSEPELAEAEQKQMSSALVAKQALDKEGATLPIKAALASARKVVVRAAPAGGKGIVVWSDPLCPHCRDLEQNIISKLPATIGVTIVPVAFKSGSRPLVSYITCGKDDADNASRWTGLMAAQPKAHIELQCPAGPLAADTNSILFYRSGLTGTPTIMSSSGDRIFEGDTQSYAAVETWIKN